MNTIITDTAVEAAYRAAATVCAEQEGESIDESLFTDAEHMTEMRPILRAALEAALPLLAAPEAGNPVSGSERERFEAWAAPRQYGLKLHASGDYWAEETSELWEAWQAALAASQPVGEPVAWYYGFSDTGEAGPVTFGGNPGAEAIAWAERHGHTLHYLYTAPPAQQPAQVDLSQEDRDMLSRCLRYCRNDAVEDGSVDEIDRLLALIDSQGVK